VFSRLTLQPSRSSRRRGSGHSKHPKIKAESAVRLTLLLSKSMMKVDFENRRRGICSAGSPGEKPGRREGLLEPKSQRKATFPHNRHRWSAPLG